MSKNKFALFSAALVALTLSACGNSGDLSKTYGRASDNKHNQSLDWSNPAFNTPQYERNNLGLEKYGAKPPVDYQGQHWTDPETGCQYTRSGRPTEVAWNLIINPPGLPLAKPSCKKMFVTVPYSGDLKWQKTGRKISKKEWDAYNETFYKNW